VKADEVHVVVVPEAKISRLLGEDPGTDISRHLARYGVSVTLDSLKGNDAGALILSKAAEIDADLIVMGAFGQSKITEFVFGSATGTLLRNATIPILLSR
jgi:nucleotide-binding universal stress UspA family protein